MLVILEFVAAKEHLKMLFKCAQKLIEVMSHPKASQVQQPICARGLVPGWGSEVGGAAGAPSSAPFLLHWDKRVPWAPAGCKNPGWGRHPGSVPAVVTPHWRPPSFLCSEPVGGKDQQATDLSTPVEHQMTR